MITRDPVSIRRRQRRCIRLSVSHQILRTRHCAVEHAHITHTLPAAMFGKLLKMRRLGHLKRDRDPVLRHDLFREFSKRPLAPRHHITGGSHLGIEIRFRRGQLNPARGLGHGKLSANRRFQMSKQLLGQDHACGIADLCDFEPHVHTDVITESIPDRNMIDNPRKLSMTKSMKVAISLPDDIFEEGEALSRQLKTSRSQLYARALREFASRHSPDALTEAYDAALAAAGDEDSAFAKEASRRIFAKSEW